MYDPFAGRWLQPDPLALNGPELLLAITSRDGGNLYRYVGNNPNGFVDPFGLWGEETGTRIANNDTWWGPGLGYAVGVGGAFAESVLTLEGPREQIAEDVKSGIAAEDNHARRGGYEPGVVDYGMSIAAQFLGANDIASAVYAYDGREDRFLTTTERWVNGVGGTVQAATAPIPGGGQAVGGAAKALGTAAKAMKYVVKYPKAVRQADDATKIVTRTNGELVQEVANRARSWGDRQTFKSDQDAGTKMHEYANKFLTRYQRWFGDRRLSTEVRYVKGMKWEPGDPVKGSVRLDVVENADSPTAIYDYKFGDAGLSAKRVDQIRKTSGVSPSVPVHEVRPGCP